LAKVALGLPVPKHL